MSQMSQKPNGGKRDMYKVLFVCMRLRVGDCVFTFESRAGVPAQECASKELPLAAEVQLESCRASGHTC